MNPILAIDTLVELVQLVGSGGGAVATVVVVIIFLRHIKETNAKRDDVLEKIGSDCHAHQDEMQQRAHDHQQRISEITSQALEQSAQIIKENGEVIRENTKMLGIVTGVHQARGGLDDGNG